MENDSPTLVKSLEGGSENKMINSRNTVILFIGVIVAGIITGFLISRIAPTPNFSNAKSLLGNDSKNSAKGVIVGSKDTKSFSDDVEGMLKEGGIEGEGQYHLERPGGVSQNVYLISSVIDLSAYVGKKVKVWGQTYEAQKAGWFMDVGRLQVL